jgi:hypothetical protein
MKTQHFNIIAVLATLLAASCSQTPETTEEEYQEFVKLNKAEVARAANVPQEVFDKAFVESGLQSFTLDDQPKTIQDFDSFYEEVIVTKYSNHVTQDNLKSRFIQHAVNYFDLSNPETAEETDYLIKMTHELLSVNQTVNPGLIYKCLAATKGRIEEREYYQMVKKATFQVRLMVEKSNEMMAAKKPSDPNEPYVMIAQTIKQWEEYQSKLNELTEK